MMERPERQVPLALLVLTVPLALLVLTVRPAQTERAPTTSQ